MNKIDQYNYESFYLDYLEGKLPAELVDELTLFLERFPHLALDDNELTHLTAHSQPEFSGKGHLKSIDLAEELVIGELEGVNSTIQMVALEEMCITNPYIKRIKSSYAKTILPNVTIIFENKEQLKQRVVWLKLVTQYAAVAAILIGVWLLVNVDNPLREFDKVMAHENSHRKSLKTQVQRLNVVQNSVKLEVEDDIVNEVMPPIKNRVKGDNPIPVLDEVLFDITLERKIDTVASNNDWVYSIVSLSEEEFDTIQNSSEELLPQKQTKNNEYTLGQVISYQIRKVLKKEAEPNFEKMESTEVLSLISSGLTNLTKQEVILAQESLGNQEITSFSIGKLEFYRSKSK
jgi:hypothetical protein